MRSRNKGQIFRLATDGEVVPHRRRADRVSLPYMFYVTVVAESKLGIQVGYRFIFAAQRIKTPRQIIELERWLSQHAIPGATLTVMSYHKVTEELH